MGYPPGEKNQEQEVTASGAVLEYLNSRQFHIGDIHREEEDNATTFTLEFSADNVASIPVRIVARDQARQVLFVAACPYVIPETHKFELIGKLTDLHRSISIGTFVLSEDLRICTFRTGVDFLDASKDLSPGILDCQMKLTLETLDAAIPELMPLLFSPDSPAQTLEEYFKGRKGELQ